ncbi:ABC transporter substrate-binding protein [Thalassobaculum fulvum]|uniref:ABC transporter substrate-binding protein n=1 Tax=Thalassobaculum fulvum TaxID=1633335 RepID=A0A919CSL0_9PROT|nr:ABC transporter substrate-binding protein [Thalassobaculum fulvum]GHD63842.1 ABC transporter substrate-binding protein [Thalassobaculum fulvum]
MKAQAIIRSTVLAATACLAAVSALAESSGVTADKIIFGQAAAFEGPAAALGNNMKLGIDAAFAEANAAGGVNGRQLSVIRYDDSYEPDKSVAATRKLIDEDKVFALIGPVGTPTTLVTQPIATEAGVPFIGPFTGAGFLRKPENGNVINVRATYDQETEAWIEYLTTVKKAQKIAILYQDDGFGRVGLAGVQKAMEKRGLKLVGEATYPRNTTAVKSAVVDLRKADPDAIVMVGAYKPIAEFVKLSRKLKMDPTFITISFVGSEALAAELGKDGAGVIISQVVPFPFDAATPVVAAYQKALAAVDPNAKPGFGSLEGYMVGRLTVEALRIAGADVTRDTLLKAIYDTGTFDLGGAVMKFGVGDNQGMETVYLTEILADGTFRAIGSSTN